MALGIRRLGPGDDASLRTLAEEDGEFDLEGRGHALEPLDEAASRRFLADPSVLGWVALEGGRAVGFLVCNVIGLRKAEARELLLYEIGVRASHRRQGVGRALLGAMESWMATERVVTAWVLADNPGAVEFYRACGYRLEAGQASYLTRSRQAAAE